MLAFTTFVSVLISSWCGCRSCCRLGRLGASNGANHRQNGEQCAQLFHLFLLKDVSTEGARNPHSSVRSPACNWVIRERISLFPGFSKFLKNEVKFFCQNRTRCLTAMAPK